MQGRSAAIWAGLADSAPTPVVPASARGLAATWLSIFTHTRACLSQREAGRFGDPVAGLKLAWQR